MEAQKADLLQELPLKPKKVKYLIYFSLFLVLVVCAGLTGYFLFPDHVRNLVKSDPVNLLTGMILKEERIRIVSDIPGISVELVNEEDLNKFLDEINFWEEDGVRIYELAVLTSIESLEIHLTDEEQEHGRFIAGPTREVYQSFSQLLEENKLKVYLHFSSEKLNRIIERESFEDLNFNLFYSLYLSSASAVDETRTNTSAVDEDGVEVNSVDLVDQYLESLSISEPVIKISKKISLDFLKGFFPVLIKPVYAGCQGDFSCGTDVNTCTCSDGSSHSDCDVTGDRCGAGWAHDCTCSLVCGGDASFSCSDRRASSYLCSSEGGCGEGYDCVIDYGCFWWGPPEPDPDPDPPPPGEGSCPAGHTIWCTWDDCGFCSSGGGTCPGGEPNYCCCPPAGPTYARVEFRAMQDFNCNGSQDAGELSIGKEGGQFCDGSSPDIYLCPPEGCSITRTGGPPQDAANPLTGFHTGCTDASGLIPRIQQLLIEGNYTFTFHAPSGWKNKTITKVVTNNPAKEGWQADRKYTFRLCPVEYYTIAGHIRDNITREGIPGAEVDIYDSTLGATQRVTTDASGRFSISNWANVGDYYAVRPVGVPAGYVAPPASLSAAWSWNYCINSNPGTAPWADTPLGSTSYECQKAGSGADCSGPNGSGTTERCNFVFDLEPYCGDGNPDPGEDCDDGNTDNTDICNVEGTDKNDNVVYPPCEETYCGDGIVQAPNGKGFFDGGSNFNEECDDGNNVNGDGCSANCINEGDPWLRTESGDVFSSVGTINSVPAEPAAEEFQYCDYPGHCDKMFSRYLYLKNLDVGANDNLSGIDDVCTYGLFWDIETEGTGSQVGTEVQDLLDYVATLEGPLVTIGTKTYLIHRNIGSDLNVDAQEGTPGLHICYTNQDINISPSVTVSDANSGIIFLAEGDINILSGDDHSVGGVGEDVIEGFLIAGGSVKTELDFGTSADYADSVLIKGGVISLEQISLERDLGVDNATNSSEKFIYDARYVDLFRPLLGTVGLIQFVESGAY